MNQAPNNMPSDMPNKVPSETSGKAPVSPRPNNGCGVGCLSVFAIMMVFVITFMNGMTDKGGRYPPLADPEIMHGEFPFQLEYEIDGEIKVIEDTVIFDYDGWKEGVGENVRVWKSTYASGAERIVLLEVENPVDMGRDAQITKQLVCYSTGRGSYYMEGPHGEKYYKGRYAYIYSEYEDGSKQEKECHIPQLYEDFKITIVSLETPPGNSATEQTQQDKEYLNEIYQKYVWPLNANSGIAAGPWATPSDIDPNSLVDFCSFNDLLNTSGESGTKQIFFVPAEEVEAALLKYFDGISPEYLRTSRYYEFDEIPAWDYTNQYYMPQGGGGGLTKALKVEEDGDILRIVVGYYYGDDTVNPIDTFLLSVRLEEDGFKYLSYETYP